MGVPATAAALPYPPSNYVHLDPWRPPTPVRRLKPRRDGCEFCCDPELKALVVGPSGRHLIRVARAFVKCASAPEAERQRSLRAK